MKVKELKKHLSAPRSQQKNVFYVDVETSEIYQICGFEVTDEFKDVLFIKIVKVKE